MDANRPLIPGVAVTSTGSVTPSTSTPSTSTPSVSRPPAGTPGRRRIAQKEPRDTLLAQLGEQRRSRGKNIAGHGKVSSYRRPGGKPAWYTGETRPSGAAAPKEPLPYSSVLFSQWKNKIPPLWLTCLPQTSSGHIQTPEGWKKWLKILPPDTPVGSLPPEPSSQLMSPKLWPAINQLLKTIDLLESRSHRALSSKEDMEIVKSHWVGPVNSPAEVNVMLHLCRIALSNRSPLTDQQKHFLTVFITSRMTTRGLKTNLFNFIQQVGGTLPAISSFMLGREVTEKEQIGQLFDVFFPSSGARVLEHFLHGTQWGLGDNPPPGINIDTVAWRFARSFLNLWNEGNSCKLNTEFNVGDPEHGDMLNSSFFSLYMRMLLGNDSHLNERQKEYLELLLDSALVMNNVELIIADEPSGWRKWVRVFDPNRDCLPGSEWADDYCPPEPGHGLGKGKGKRRLEPPSPASPPSEDESSSDEETEEEGNGLPRSRYAPAAKRPALSEP